jgi:hypothetical protein
MFQKTNFAFSSTSYLSIIRLDAKDIVRMAELLARSIIIKLFP